MGNICKRKKKEYIQLDINLVEKTDKRSQIIRLTDLLKLVDKEIKLLKDVNYI